MKASLDLPSRTEKKQAFISDSLEINQLKYNPRPCVNTCRCRFTITKFELTISQQQSIYYACKRASPKVTCGPRSSLAKQSESLSALQQVGNATGHVVQLDGAVV